MILFCLCGVSCNSEEAWQPTPVLLPGKSHGQRSLVGCSPWGREESDMTEPLHFHFSLSHIGEGNGNPLWCSCLENPRDGGAWWAAVYGIAQGQTQLKRLSSSSSYNFSFFISNFIKESSPFYLFMSLDKSLSILFIFSKKQLLISLIFFIVFFVSIHLFLLLWYLWFLFFFLLIWGFVYSFSNCCRSKVRFGIIGGMLFGDFSCFMKIVLL